MKLPVGGKEPEETALSSRLENNRAPSLYLGAYSLPLTSPCNGEIGIYGEGWL